MDLLAFAVLTGWTLFNLLHDAKLRKREQYLDDTLTRVLDEVERATDIVVTSIWQSERQEGGDE